MAAPYLASRKPLSALALPLFTFQMNGPTREALLKLPAKKYCPKAPYWVEAAFEEKYFISPPKMLPASSTCCIHTPRVPEEMYLYE